MTTPDTLTHTASEDDAGTRVDRILADRFTDYSRSQIQRAADMGALFVNGEPAKSNYKIAKGDQISLTLSPPVPSGGTPVGEDIPLEVIFEDDDLLVINKAAGMVVHPAAGHRSGTLVNALLGRGAFDDDEIESSVARPGIVHRLDKGTSGLMVVARSEQSHRRLAQQLKDRTLKRSYWAVCWGHLKTSPMEINAPVGRSSRDRKVMAVNNAGRQAHTSLRVLERFTLVDCVEATLSTGRTHQIRVHLSHLGHPLVSDTDYGGGAQQLKGIDPRWRLHGKQLLDTIARPALHAHTLAFSHPTTAQPLSFTANPPEDFQNLLLQSQKIRA